MAHIIALQGPGNSGKTSTLIQVFKDLQAKYPSATVQALHGATNDIKVVLHGVNGKIVGIESQGDPGSRLQQSLPDLLAAKCDVIFCACRTRGATVSWVSAYMPPHKVQFVQQTRTTRGHASANSATAAALIKLAGL